MKTKGVVTIVACVALIGGCSSEAPKCSDRETKSLALEVIQGVASDLFEKKVIYGLAMSRGMGMQVDIDFSKISFSLESIRVQNTNKDTGNHLCNATLVTKMDDRKNEQLITYSSELANNEKNIM